MSDIEKVLVLAACIALAILGGLGFVGSWWDDRR